MSQHQLRDHQIKALKNLSNGKILCGKPGSGKSLVAATYYKEHEAPRDVYVITTARKRDSFDWQEEFYRLDIGPATGPTPIPGDKRKSLSGRNHDRKSEGGDGSSSRGTNAESGMVRGSTNLREAEIPIDGRTKDVSSGLLGRSGDSTDDAGRDPTTLSGRSVHKASSSRLGRSSSELQRSGLSEKSDLSVEGFGHKYSSSDSSGVLLPESGTSSSCGQSDRDREGTYPWVLTVDSWNNIAKYANVSGAFFIFDEQRLVGSGDWTRKFLRIAKRNRWILLSATPGDTWMDYIPVFVANNFYKNRTAFIREHVVYNTFTKFPKVDRYINVGRLVRQRKELLVDMPFESHTKRRLVEVPLPYDKALFERVVKDRWHVYEDRPLRDVGEMFSVMRKVVNSDPSRLEMVRELWKIHPKLIVFYNFNYELELLRGLSTQSTIISTTSQVSNPKAGSDQILSAKNLTTSTGTPNLFGGHKQSNTRLRHPDKNIVTIGESTAKKKKSSPTEFRVSPRSNLTSIPTIKQILATGLMRIGSGTISTSRSDKQSMRISEDSKLTPTTAIAEWNGHKHQPIPSSERWLYLVQYAAGAEAWNCVETDAMIMYSRNYSWKATEQSYGRIDRLNTSFQDLWYYIFMSDSFIDKAIGRSLDAKGTFNEAKYKSLFTR